MEQFIMDTFENMIQPQLGHRSINIFNKDVKTKTDI